LVVNFICIIFALTKQNNLKTDKNMKIDLIYAISEVAEKIQRKNGRTDVILKSSIIIPLTTISIIRVASIGDFRMIENTKANGTESDWLPLAMLDTDMLNNILSMLKSMDVE
jgi:hypothetical protein